eukprot:SAG31_NODE_11693_length_1006_cov_1.205072_2_plen_73_part_01
MCCECGGGSTTVIKSCNRPAGQRWEGEVPVDCAAAGLRPISSAALAAQREGAGGGCGVDGRSIASARPCTWVG